MAGAIYNLYEYIDDEKARYWGRGDQIREIFKLTEKSEDLSVRKLIFRLIIFAYYRTFKIIRR